MAGDRGLAAEALVEALLVGAGWRVLGRRVRIGRGELDLVAVDPGPPRRAVVVEVRWRSQRAFGLPEETLDPRKRRALRRAMAGLRLAGRLPGGPDLPAGVLRFDLVVVEPPARRGQPSVVRHHRDLAP